MFKNLRPSRFSSLVSSVFIFALLATPSLGQRRQSATGPPSSSGGDPLKVLQWRSIGPFRGGRVTAVTGVASQPMVFYFGGTGGGVWKTMDGGINWEPITDGSVFGTGSVGAIGLSDSDPNTIYVGMGESPIRGNVSHGDGVYKSTDGGKTWKHIGLKTRDKFRAFAYTRKIRTLFTLRRRDTCGRRMNNAACFDRRMAARPGRKSSFAATKPAPAI